ncbi:hypothetical protein B0T17DRAFT_466787, partial [Bombardia bombarda]
MVIKRKRSESELSFNSTFSSPSRPDSGNMFDFSSMETTRRGPFSLSPQRPSTPSHLHSRTLKRFRDNRPSETQVHEHTLSLLYSAQQQQQQQHQFHNNQPTPTLSSQPEAVSATAQSQRTTHQRSLHSFWNLPVLASSSTAPSPAPLPTPVAHQSTPTSCEDCGVGLGGGSGSDDSTIMDVDDYGLGDGEHSCGACGKTVCFSCSISNLGEHRRCLACAEPRALVGGIGGGW